MDRGEPSAHTSSSRTARGSSRTGDFHAATVPLARARDLEPDKTSVREALGRALFGSQPLQRGGRRSSSEIVERAPTNDYALFCLGRSLQLMGRHAEARRPLALAANLRPDRSDYRQYRDRRAGGRPRALLRSAARSRRGSRSRRRVRRGRGARTAKASGSGSAERREVATRPTARPEGMVRPRPTSRRRTACRPRAPPRRASPRTSSAAATSSPSSRSTSATVTAASGTSPCRYTAPAAVCEKRTIRSVRLRRRSACSRARPGPRPPPARRASRPAARGRRGGRRRLPKPSVPTRRERRGASVAPLSRRESSTALPGYTVLSSPDSFRWGPVDCRRRSESGRSPAFLLSEGG